MDKPKAIDDATDQDGASQRIDPFLMSVLASRFEAIIREMTNTVMKACHGNFSD